MLVAAGALLFGSARRVLLREAAHRVPRGERAGQERRGRGPGGRDGVGSASRHGETDLLGDHVARRLRGGRDGNFDWAAPDEEVHTFFNDLERPVGTHLYGRRMYEVMAAWETLGTRGRAALHRATSRRSGGPPTRSCTRRRCRRCRRRRTRIERDFDPDAIREMKATAARDISVGGPGLAAHAIAAGLVDDYHLVVDAGSGGRRHAVPPQRRPRCGSSWWTSADSETAWFTCTTDPRRRERPLSRTGVPQGQPAPNRRRKPRMSSAGSMPGVERRVVEGRGGGEPKRNDARPHGQVEVLAVVQRRPGADLRRCLVDRQRQDRSSTSSPSGRVPECDPTGRARCARPAPASPPASRRAR